MQKRSLTIFPATVMLVALSCSAGADDQPPSTPELTYATYSDSATEIFWTRSTDDSVVINYELTRNGLPLYSGDGLSYFDDSMVLGERYIYEVVATGEDGLSSPAGATIVNDDVDLPGFISPTTPTGFRADVYSSSSLELFWDRPSDDTFTYVYTDRNGTFLASASTSYFVYQDGVLLDLVDGTSFYINTNINSGNTYSFELEMRRVDVFGNVSLSDSVTVDVTIPGSGGDESTPPSGGSTDSPSKPANLSLSVYSRSAAELFWDRAPSSERISGTDVYRDGVLLGSTQGNSFYDDTRASRTGYTYTVIANNQDGRSSIESQYPIQVAATAEFNVNRDNVEDVVFNISRIVRGWVVNDLVTRAKEFVYPSIDGVTLESSMVEDFGRRGTQISNRYSCSGGGQMTTFEPANLSAIDIDVELIDCNLGGRVFTGAIDYQFGPGGRSYGITEFTSIFPGGNRVVLSGFYSPVQASSGLGGRFFRIDSYEEFNADGTKRPVLNYLTEVSVAADSPIFSSAGADDTHTQLMLSSNWNASGPFSNDVGLEAVTTQVFSKANPGDLEYSTGRLEVTADNGLVLTIDADTGDLRTFSVFVQQGEAVSEYTFEWNDRYRFVLM